MPKSKFPVKRNTDYKKLSEKDKDELIKKLRKHINEFNEINLLAANNNIRVELSYENVYIGFVEFPVQDYKVRCYKQV